MEIRAVNNNIEILQSLTRNDDALNFKKGDVVVAEIVAINGDVIALKTGDDLLLTGKLLAELEFQLGQQMEFEVAGKSGNKFILQTLSSNMDSVEISSNTPEQSVESRESLVISSLINNLGFNATQENIGTIQSAMTANSSLDIKTAVFMFTNGIAFTEENIQSINNLETNSENISNNLSNILNQIVLDKAFPESVEAKINLQYIEQTATQQPNNINAPILSDNNHANTARATISVNDGYYTVAQETIVSEPVIAESASQNAAELLNELGPQDSRSINISSSPQQSESNQIKALLSNLLGNSPVVDNATVNQETEQLQNQTISPESVDFSETLTSISEDRALQNLLPKLISIFTRIDDIKNGKNNIKQIDDENVQKLVQLKEAIKNSDIKNRDVLAAKTEELIAQNKVSSEVKRFAFFNIPINFHNSQQTAEIYVYKRRNKKKAKSSSEMSILIGLDTQNLGRFEVLVRADKKNLSIKMSRESELANEVIELRERKLKKAFGDMGYSLSSFKIEKLQEKTTVANAEQVLSSGIGSSSRIDYTV